MQEIKVSQFLQTRHHPKVPPCRVCIGIVIINWKLVEFAFRMSRGPYFDIMTIFALSHDEAMSISYVSDVNDFHLPPLRKFEQTHQPSVPKHTISKTNYAPSDPYLPSLFCVLEPQREHL